MAMLKVKVYKARVIMKFTVLLVDLLVKIAQEVYGTYFVYENGRKLLYVQVLKSLYEMLVAFFIWSKKFRNDLENKDLSLIYAMSVLQIYK